MANPAPATSDSPSRYAAMSPVARTASSTISDRRSQRSASSFRSSTSARASATALTNLTADW